LLLLKTEVNRMVRRKTTTILIILVLTASAAAQNGYKGKEFWLVFPQNARSGENQSSLEQNILIFGQEGIRGSINNTLLGKKYNYQIGASQTVTFRLDTLNIVAEGKHSNTWFITSSEEVSVTAISHRSASTDSYAVLPVNRLGKEYAVIGYYPLKMDSPLNIVSIFSTQFDIVATEDNTTVLLAFPPSSKREPRKEILNRGNALHYNSDNISGKPGDLTGTIVTSDKPIAFLTGHACAQVPAKVTFCDVLLEMLPPTSELGKEHIVTKLAGSDHCSIRIVAVTDNTEVLLNGKWETILNRGDFYQNDTIAGSGRITTSEVVYVMQYGQSIDISKIADPFMMLIAPCDKFMNKVEFAVPNLSGTWQHYVNVVTTRKGAESLTIDNIKLVDKYFKQVGTTDFVMAEIEVGGYSHHWLRSDLPFAAYQYGYGAQTYDSYGHLCGMK
jgi:hypothetical protein